MYDQGLSHRFHLQYLILQLSVSLTEVVKQTSARTENV